MSRRREQGGIFIVTLAVLLGLVLVAVAVTENRRQSIRGQLVRTESLRAQVAAESGVERAMAELSVLQANSPTLLTDAWATLGNAGDDDFRLEGARMRMQVVDANAFINLNSAGQTQLQQLPLTTEQIDSILDWREGNREPRPEGGKDEFYNNLPDPYNAKLRRFDSVEELLLVKGFIPRDLYQVNTEIVNSSTAVGGSTDQQLPLIEMLTVDSYTANVTATGGPKLNINGPQVNPPLLAQRLGIPLPQAILLFAGRPYARIGDVIARAGGGTNVASRILDEITLSNQPRLEGRLNLNTVPEEILRTVPGVTPDVAQAIVQRQQQGFTTLGELTQIPGLNSTAVLQQVADLFTVSSQSFIVRVLGEAGQTRYATEALIVIENNVPRLLRQTPVPVEEAIDRWRWQVDPSTEVELVQP